MNEKCCGCHKKIRWYHKKGGGDYPYNSSWHRHCAISHNYGYDTARKHAEEMNIMYGLPTPNELYWLHQPQPQPASIGIPKMQDFKKKYNIGTDNKILMKNIY